MNPAYLRRFVCFLFFLCQRHRFQVECQLLLLFGFFALRLLCGSRGLGLLRLAIEVHEARVQLAVVLSG